jgi:hypothetical protein
MEQINRPVLFQPFSSFVLPVAITPTPLLASPSKSDLIDSFIISVDSGAANNVFIGDGNVTVNSGIEIVAGGGPVNFVIRNQDQQYELQIPVMEIAKTLQCQSDMPFAVPFIIWDCSQIFLIAALATNVRVMLFRSQFV